MLKLGSWIDLAYLGEAIFFFPLTLEEEEGGGSLYLFLILLLPLLIPNPREIGGRKPKPC